MNRLLIAVSAFLLLQDLALAKSKAVTSRPREDDGEPVQQTEYKAPTAMPKHEDSRSRGKQRELLQEAPSEMLSDRINGRLVLRIANFESKEERNDFDGGYFGIWERNPDDPTQYARMKFFEPGQGYGYTCLRINYDVDSPNDAYNGFWMLFVDADLTRYKYLCFWIRGDNEMGFTTRFTVELKNEDESGRTLVDSVTGEWQLIELPLEDFVGIENWSKMTEFVIVFEDRLVSAKTGAFYIDNIYFSE